jgi:hypothetical protein
MKSIDSALLENWDALWRYPDLAAEVFKGGTLDAAEAARKLVRNIAISYTPRQAFTELLDAGEFQAAGRLLGSPRFMAEVNAGQPELEAALHEAHARAVNRLEVRQFELTTRALRAGLPAEPPEWKSAAEKRAASGHARLDEWELLIAEAEESRQVELRARLAAALSARPDEAPGRAEWEKAVEKAVERRQFETASRLLDAGQMEADESDPTGVPQRPLWPSYRNADTLMIIRRFLGPGTSELKETWGPMPGDEAARVLLEGLEDYTAGLARGSSREEVERFVAALDAFLGAAPADNQVRLWGQDGYSAVLYSVVEPRVPRLAGGGNPKGVTLWLPRTPQTPIPPQLLPPPLMVAFHPEAPPIAAELVLKFTATSLFRLLGDTNRRVNLIRRLARQLDLADIMPDGFVPESLPESVGDDVARGYSAWFFDYHGLDIGSDTVLELITYYCIASRDLLCTLLGEIIGRLRSRDEIISTAHVHSAWYGAKFRDAAVRHVLGGVAADPWLLAVLTGAHYVAGATGGVTADDITTLLTLVFDDSTQELRLGLQARAETDVLPALRELAGAGLLALGEADGQFRLPRTARTMLVREHLGNLESRIREMLASFGAAMTEPPAAP